ncbi:helix-turn-helix transcriptional regulator [Lactiplantibacillus plantarum]|nr:helix-turn-helix transcriptional regulator [Lactiplantibacillus plantarum]
MKDFNLFLKAENLNAYKITNNKVFRINNQARHLDLILLSTIKKLKNKKCNTMLVYNKDIYLSIYLDSNSTLLLTLNMHTKVLSIDAALDLDLIGRSKSICDLAYHLYTGKTNSQQIFPFKTINMNTETFTGPVNSLSIDKTYKNEQSLLSSVTSLDEKAVMESLNRTTHAQIIGNIFESQKFLRGKKDIIISFVAKLTQKVIEAGLPINQAFSMQDFVIERIELQLIPETFDVWYYEIAWYYFKKFKDYRLTYSYSLSEKCKNYIDHHYTERITLVKLTRILNCSKPILCQNFKKDNHMTINSYIRIKKIKRAKSLLIQTNYSSTEIAQYLSFSDRSHFSKVFKKLENCTPQEFRRTNLKYLFNKENSIINPNRN